MDCHVKPGNDEGSYIASAEPRDLLRPVYRDVEVGHQTVGERIDPAVHAEILAAGPGFLHEHVVGDVPHLADHVELAQAVQAAAFLRNGFELVAMVVPDFADRMQPMVHEAAPPPVDRGGDTAAAIVANHHDVLHPEHVDGELQHREVV